jgi:hypothetical protein
MVNLFIFHIILTQDLVLVYSFYLKFIESANTYERNSATLSTQTFKVFIFLVVDISILIPISILNTPLLTLGGFFDFLTVQRDPLAAGNQQE